MSIPTIDTNDTLQSISPESDLRTDQGQDIDSQKVKHIARKCLGDLSAATAYPNPSESPCITRCETPASYGKRMVPVPNNEEGRKVRFKDTKDLEESRESGGLSSALDLSLQDSFDRRYSSAPESEEDQVEIFVDFNEDPEAEAQYVEYEPWKEFPKKPQAGSPHSLSRSKSQQNDGQTPELTCAILKSPDSKPSSKVKTRSALAGCALPADAKAETLSIFLKSNIAVYPSKISKTENKTTQAEVGYILRNPTEILPGIIIDHHQGKHAKFPGVFNYQGGRGDGVFNQGMKLTDLEEMFNKIITNKIFPFLDTIPEVGKESPPKIQADVSHLKGIFKNYNNITICAAYNRNFNCWEIHIYPT